MTTPMQTPRPPAETPEVFAFNLTPDMAKALAAFQSHLPKIEKNRLVEVETKEEKDDYDYSYATLDHVSEEVLPELAKHGLSFVSFPGTGTGGRLAVRYFLIHESGGYIGTEWPISSEAKGMRAVQNLGGLITYVRRYALQAATGVSPEMDDDDLRSAVQAEKEAAAPATVRRQRGQAARQEQAAENTARVRRQAAAERVPEGTLPTGPPPDEDAPPTRRNPDGPLTVGEQRKIFAQLGDIDPAITARGEENRQKRLALVGDLTGRALKSINDLTSGQAGQVIEILDLCIAAGDTTKARREALDAAVVAAVQDAAATQPDSEGNAA